MPAVSLPKESASNRRPSAVRDILLYGVCGGVLVVVLKLTEYRCRTVEARLVLSGRIFRQLMSAINELRLAFFRRLGRLARMKFAPYCYGWRFTYRTNQKRGAVV